jgi:uncharacterized protein involved in response to NO
MKRTETLFSYGFRIFFLSCAAYAVALMVAWIGVFTFGWGVAGSRPMIWHAHEMLLGVASAAIAGFLLTAVPNWTGTDRLHGRGLAGLCLLWFAGRLAFWVVDPFAAGDAALVARVIDLAFLPTLALIVARPIIATGNRRNLIVIALLGGLSAANLGLTLIPTRGPLLLLDLVTMLMILIGGRIAPLFTRNWLLRRGLAGDAVQSHGWLDAASIASMAAVLFAHLIGLAPGLVGITAIIASLFNLARLIEWQGWRAWRDPLVWVLHLGYLWIVIALMIRGFGHLTEAVSARAWIHAAGVGAMGTLIIGVMPRVSLGHTGRPLKLPRGGSSLFWLISFAALARTGNALGLFDHAWALTAAGLAWITAFSLFILYFLPVLAAPRADGRPD